MEIKIIKETENKLLARREIVANVLFEKATPTRKDIQKELAKKIKSAEELSIIKQIKTNFGEASAVVTAYVYSDKEIMTKTERKNLIEKHAGHEPKPEGEGEKTA